MGVIQDLLFCAIFDKDNERFCYQLLYEGRIAGHATENPVKKTILGKVDHPSKLLERVPILMISSFCYSAASSKYF